MLLIFLCFAIDIDLLSPSDRHLEQLSRIFVDCYKLLDPLRKGIFVMGVLQKYKKSVEVYQKESILK